MKRICVITTVSSSMKGYMIPLTRAIGKENATITLICNMDGTFREAFSGEFECVHLGLERGAHPVNLLTSFFKLFLILKKGRYDMVEYSTPNASACASLASWCAGVPARVYCLFGIRYTGFDGPLRSVFKWMERIVCGLSTRILLDSASNIDFAVAEGLFRRSKASLIHNGSAGGVDLGRYSLPMKSRFRNAVRKRHGIGEEEFVIGFVGRIVRDKGIEELLAAARSMLKGGRKLRLMLVGNIEPADPIDAGLMEWARSAEEVKFCGYVPNPEEYFASFDLFVFPSYREGFGGGIIQAGAFEVPSVVSNIGPLVESMEAGFSGLVCRLKDVSSLIEKIETLMDDPALRLEMGKRERSIVVEKFDKEAYMASYGKLIWSILGDRA
jgi:glycosyltransferase involved in cell wall biosynthesis